MIKILLSNAGGAGSIPVWRAKLPHASWPKNQNPKQKQHCNKFNQDLKWFIFLKRASLVAQLVKNLPALWETWV